MTGPVAKPETDSVLPAGPYVLAGPVEKPVGGRLPLRGDLAHIALAGRYFVPHYAVPMPRIVGTKGAPLLAAGKPDAAQVMQLAAGSVFDVLDIQADWAWGTCSLEGPVGYVALADLEAAG